MQKTKSEDRKKTIVLYTSSIINEAYKELENNPRVRNPEAELFKANKNKNIFDSVSSPFNIFFPK